MPTPTLTVLQPTPLSSGFYFGESPRYNPRDDLLYMSDMTGCKIYTIDPTSGKSHAIVEVPQQPNGMCFASDGSLIYSSMFDSKLHRFDIGTGKSSLLADLSPFMTGYCGDMVIDAFGRIYIDDTGARVLHGEEGKPGRLLVVDPATGHVSVAAEDLLFPNGIAIDGAGTKLVLSESAASRLETFHVNPKDGALSDRQTVWDTHALVEVVGEPADRFAAVDGLCMDAEDGVWMSMLSYGVFVRRDKMGILTHRVDVAGHATACALGGEDGRTLFLVVNKLPEPGSMFEAMVGKKTKCSVLTVRVEVGRGEARP